MVNKKKKYICVTGGVLSSIGKGISASSLGMLLERRGIKVTMIKMDPYLNVDPGTMSPYQHGEVFVLDDGSETDLDLGHYSRFVQNAKFGIGNNFTTGKIYDSVIRKEREGGYLGQTVQVIPHITDEIKRRIRAAAQDFDLGIVEVGGTVGDIESQPFLEAIRQLKHEEGGENVLFIHITLVPFIPSAGELKTKPTQHSVKELREIGVQPDILLCRSDRELSREVKEKIGLFCNVPAQQVFTAVDVDNIYKVPLKLHEEGLDEKVSEKLGIWSGRPDLTSWKEMLQRIENPQGEVRVGIVGKYTKWLDTYKSLTEAINHGGVHNQVKVNLVYIDSDEIEEGNSALLADLNGILVPGGFGERGADGKIKTIEYARKNKIPFFGICLGMQLAVVEFARNVCGLSHANSAEFSPEGNENVIDLMESQKSLKELGGTMRLGGYDCNVLETHNGKVTFAYQAYRSRKVSERHRHRFEVSNQFLSRLEEGGLVISGKHLLQDTNVELVEMVEYSNHPWFLACQFHPEFKSKPLQPHPLFSAFIAASKEHHQRHGDTKEKNYN